MDWQAYLAAAAQRLGLPVEYAQAIVQGESGGDPTSAPKANTNGTRDYGLFQLNTGGQGAGLSVPQLLDPHTNIDVGIKPVAAAYKAGSSQGLVGYPLFKYTADNSGHRSIDITHPGRTLSLWQQFVASAQTGFSPSSPNSPVPEYVGGPQAGATQVQAAADQNTAASKSAADLQSGMTGFLTKSAAPFALALFLILTGGLILGLGAIHES